MTGAARGIGAEVAARLAADGYAIAALDIRSCAATVADLESAGHRVVEHRCDVRDFDSVGRVVEDIEAQQGPINAVASVAGVWDSVPFLELDAESWHRLLDVNLTGSFNICRQAASRMAARRAGAIVCISSNAAYMAWLSGAHYSASKAGLIGLVKGMALELGPVGVRVNAIAPGTVRTPASQDELGDAEIASMQAAACPLGRIGEPSDIAEAVSFLLDPVRAAWITGMTMLVDGGFGTHGEGWNFGSTMSSVVTVVGRDD